MEIPILLILLCCVYKSYASHHSHTIPVEGYETELQNLGQHVEIPETPVKVIKITKTIAVKIPVPYPVKVREKVPYPVPVAKPYPVPVPQIIKVPHIVSTKSDEHGSSDGGYGGLQGSHQLSGQSSPYHVQELSAHDSSSGGHSYGPESQSFSGYNSGHGQNLGQDYSSDGSSGGSYEEPASYYGNSGNGNDFESKSYDTAIKDYFNKNQLSSSHNEGSNDHSYH
ncbi:filaggrin-2-like [Achroia grisella]|uniref:filaggrin-2-like n=1 Tax=Achroia grisella TaxID=688607 RepID=UPI0027D21EA0|nr:filaggrin-2-like [Achroia grisella]